MDIQNIDSKPLIKALLWAGIEDYCALWQSVWEVNTLLPNVDEQTRFDLTRILVKALLKARDIHLVSVKGQQVTLISITDSYLLLEDIQNWNTPKTLDDIQICFDTTDAGQKRYQAMFS